MGIKYLDKNRAELTFSVGTGAARRRQKKIITYTTKKDAERQYRYYYNLFVGATLDGTIKDLVQNYLSYLKEKKTVKATTLKGYDYSTRKITADIGPLQVREVTSKDIQKYITRLETSNLSPKSIKNIVSYLSSAFDQAVATGTLPSNPCAKIHLPKQKKPDIVILKQDQIDIMLKESLFYGLDFKVCLELAVYMGLRRSEILGLKESDIDIEKRLLHVKRTRHEIDGKSILQDTKTETSTRTLVIPEIVLQDIKELLDHHKKYKTDFLVLTSDHPMRPDYTKETLRRLWKRCDIPEVTLHGLRHTCASMLNASNQFDIAEISSFLGHSSINTTHGVYTHIFDTATKSSERISDYIDRQNSPQKSSF